MENLNENSLTQATQSGHLSIPTMLPLKKVIHHTGLSSTTIYDMLDRKSKRYDPEFPVQVKLSKGRVAWVDIEVAQWLESKIAARTHTA